MRTRFAPSPTGDLHVGGSWTALASWVLARAAAGKLVIRVEDIDTPRVVRGSEERILEDLAWLGLTWDGPVARQSTRSAFYDEALAELAAQGRLYPCDCSRAEIARIASAPHAGEETVYPGTCRDKDPRRSMKKEPSLRFRIATSDHVPFTDGVQGEVDPRLVQRMGDFVLRRGDGLFAYQLAVAVDDLEMGITDVVRGADLLASAPRQLLLMKTLSARGRVSWAPEGGPLPLYAHVALVLCEHGERLAKRTPLATVRDLRARGATSEVIVGKLAFGLGLLARDQPASAEDVVREMRQTPIRFRKDPWTWHPP